MRGSPRPSVEIINEKSTRIYNKRDGVVYQVVINNTINNEYIRMPKEGQHHGRDARDLYPPQEIESCSPTRL
jgi:hypothetical protein